MRSLSISEGTGEPCFPSSCIGGALLDEVVTAEGNGNVGRESMSAPIRLAKVMGGSFGSFGSSEGSGDVLNVVLSSNSQVGGGKTTGGGLGPVYESTIDSPNDLR